MQSIYIYTWETSNIMYIIIKHTQTQTRTYTRTHTICLYIFNFLQNSFTKVMEADKLKKKTKRIKTHWKVTYPNNTKVLEQLDKLSSMSVEFYYLKCTLKGTWLHCYFYGLCIDTIVALYTYFTGIIRGFTCLYYSMF